MEEEGRGRRGGRRERGGGGTSKRARLIFMKKMTRIPHVEKHIHGYTVLERKKKRKRGRERESRSVSQSREPEAFTVSSVVVGTRCG